MRKVILHSHLHGAGIARRRPAMLPPDPLTAEAFLGQATVLPGFCQAEPDLLGCGTADGQAILLTSVSP
jgi:hypothetical protein